MKTILLMASIALFSATAGQAQIKNAKTESLKVYGNCGMCKSTIEKAGSKKKKYKTDWNVDTKIATITYDSKKTSIDEVLKSIALSGYDNEKYLAPGDSYKKLPACCQYERERKTTVEVPVKDAETSKHNHSVHNSENQVPVKQSKDQLQAIFDNYFAIKDALVRTDGNAASAKAQDLLTLINSVKMESLNPNEHTVWMEVGKGLAFDAEHISETKDASHQRDHFTTLSTNMYKLVKVSKPTETIYYQNCPMFNDGKGANWLSKENTVKNPYYGSKMMTCGKTIETIK